MATAVIIPFFFMARELNNNRRLILNMLKYMLEAIEIPDPLWQF
jgi:hypothetical protein